jgi:hypothetical protein
MGTVRTTLSPGFEDVVNLSCVRLIYSCLQELVHGRPRTIIITVFVVYVHIRHAWAMMVDTSLDVAVASMCRLTESS